MLTQTVALSAGQTIKFIDLGNFLRVLSAINPITVRTYSNGVVATESAGVSSGYAEQFGDGNQFDAVEIYSATAQTVQIVIRNGQIVYYDQAPSGSVSVSNTPNVSVASLTPCQSSGSNSQKTVTSSAAQLLASNTSRKYLLVQNNDTSGDIFLNFGGTATTANGLKIKAGQSYELSCNILTSAISAIGSIASNTSIIVIEG